MPSGLLIRLRPVGPWRIGPDSGDRDRVDRVYHSDSLYSAVTSAMSRLGMLEEWLEATVRAPEPAVRFSSCFPYQGDTLLVVPPRNLWPPPPSSKIRWKGARFVPLSVVKSLAAGQGLSEDGWVIDGPSECLLPFSTPPSPGPFRVSVRSSAAVDREGESVSPHSTACVEFTPGSGLWCVVHFDNNAANNAAQQRWTKPLTAAFRLLSDSGFGGKRSQGWGRAEMPEITEDLIEVHAKPDQASAYWMLSLFHPAATDTVEWSQGNYALTTRGGRVESDARWGDPKKQTRMVTEGSVLVASAEPRGSAADVAPEGFPHPVYRAGFALAIPIPLSVARTTAS
ncbi:MAG TPA: type III-A CRISPR-associated RAMP protein Csm4 [Bryobacteraceae bacterium]|jgi:CRISPR type III-A-associated RAMP protein Csm4|nr:type III-A CRISPR-associated RAMP protein Csm4 [Bryobacteraceae bacterium]